MSESMENIAGRAICAAKKAMGAKDKDVYHMNSTDQGNITKLAIELLRWDAARLATEAAMSRRKPMPASLSS